MFFAKIGLYHTKEVSEMFFRKRKRKVSHAQRERIRAQLTAGMRRAVLRRDNYTCRNPKCRAKKTPFNHLVLEVDHIIPVSKGGRSEMRNLQTLCLACNRRKGDKIIKTRGW